MIIEEIKNIKSGKKDLRKFGITMGAVFAVIGGFLWWRNKDYYFYFLGLATAFILLGLAIPFLLKPIHKFWMGLAVLMSWVMTRVILSVLFYFGITPISFLARLFGKDFLGLKFNRNNTNSYWIPKERKKFERDSYEKQF
ncbi:MAG: SxtJ family membrane protein [Candidatus Brocadia sp.]|nr:SxtJ family membrane protein [Candidatus Brocadia sp.]